MTPAPGTSAPGNAAILEQTRRLAEPEPKAIPRAPVAAGEEWFARISGAGTQDGTNFRWTYPITEIYKATAGYGGWADRSGGRTGTAYSLAEDGNTSSGVQMTGVDTANLTGTYAHQKLPVGRKVKVRTVPVAAGGYEYWIVQSDNSVDGECP